MVKPIQSAALPSGLRKKTQIVVERPACMASAMNEDDRISLFPGRVRKRTFDAHATNPRLMKGCVRFSTLGGLFCQLMPWCFIFSQLCDALDKAALRTVYLLGYTAANDPMLSPFARKGAVSKRRRASPSAKLRCWWVIYHCFVNVSVCS